MVNGVLQPRHSGKAVLQTLAKLFLHPRVSIKPQGLGQSHHGGLAHSHALSQLRGREEDGLLVVVHDILHDPSLGWGEPDPIVDEQFLEWHAKNPSEKIIIAFLLNNLLVSTSN